MSVNLTAIQGVFEAIQPILNWVGPIVITSLALSFIRSFFD